MKYDISLHYIMSNPLNQSSDNLSSV